MAVPVKVALLLLLTTVLVSVFSEARSNPGTYSQSATPRQTNRFKRLVDISDIWTQLTEHVTSVIEHVVPQPVRDFFAPGPQKSDHNSDAAIGNQLGNATKESEVVKEHGQLDFFGRDLVKRVGKTITDIGDKLGLGATKGLDVDKSFFGGVAANFKDHIRAIYPGTRWCGDGDIAKSKEDLGYFRDADRCCREHDSCNDTIASEEKRDGLENSGLFTRSNCECDRKFYDCLKTANTVVSNKIGFTYFTVLGPQCFMNEYPISGCGKTQWKRCVNYEFDFTKEPHLQWFDNPIY